MDTNLPNNITNAIKEKMLRYLIKRYPEVMFYKTGVKDKERAYDFVGWDTINTPIGINGNIGSTIMDYVNGLNDGSEIMIDNLKKPKWK